MDIQALSMNMAQSQVMNNAAISVMKLSMDNIKQSGAQLTEMIERAGMERTVNPHIGGNIDVSV